MNLKGGELQMTMETVSQQTLMEKPKEVLDRVSEKHIPTLVTKDDHPTMVILPYETYQQLTQSRKEHLRKVYDNLQTWVDKNSESLKGLDSVKLVRETRERR
jgi:prevent-host-death family protein